MKNTEKLKARIEEFKNDKTYPGYICIGYGIPGDLSSKYDLFTKDIYALRDDDKRFISGWTGCYNDLKYYISEEFAVRNGLYYPVLSLEEELSYAKQMVEKFASKKHDLYDRVDGKNENFTGELRWEIRHNSDYEKLSGRTIAYMKKYKKEWAVVLLYGCYSVPVAEMELREKPTQVNDNYNAVVKKIPLPLGAKPFHRKFFKSWWTHISGFPSD